MSGSGRTGSKSYCGDISRKRKLDKQKEGKKKMR
jgi:translation elongation factor EF-4